MPKENKKETVEVLGKKFEFVRIEDIKKGPIIFFEEHSLKLAKEAYKILKPKKIYTIFVTLEFLNDPLFCDLEYINVSADSDIDISPLHSLKNLKTLWFNYNGLPTNRLDFSQFPKLETLHYRWLEGSKNLSSLSNLKSIYISNFPEFDLNALKDLHKLNSIEIYHPRIESLVGIENLKNLKELKITISSKIKSLESLGQISTKRLKKIEICSEYEIPGIEEISELHTLQSLKLDFVQTLDGSHLEKYSKLKELSIKSINEVVNVESLNNLTELRTLAIGTIKNIDHLNFLSSMPHLKKVNLLPMRINVKAGTLPLIQKYRSLNKLKTLFKWDGIYEHLDEEGKEQYKEHMGDSPLHFIRKHFKFHAYEDYSEPYTKTNCNRVDVEIRLLVDRLIENADKTTEAKLSYFEETANALNKIDDELELFATGEREYLWDTLDEIAEKSGIDVETLEESDSKNVHFKWPVF